MKTVSAVFISATIVLASLGNAYATSYTYTSLSYAGDPTYATYAIGINDWGTVVGYYGDATTGWHAYSLNGGTYTSLDKPGASQTVAYGINNGGVIVGRYQDNAGWHAFSLSGGTYTTYDYPGASRTDAYGINGLNNGGTIVGAYAYAGWSDTNPAGWQAYSLSGGTYTTLNYPSNSIIYTAATGINDWGTIVGQYYDATGAHGFSLRDGTYSSPLDYPGASGITNVVRINNLGTIVGYAGTLDGGTGFTLSDGVYSPLQFPGAPNSIADGINDWGTVVGYYRDPLSGMITGFLANPIPEPCHVPEPSTMLFLGVCLVGLAGARRKHFTT